MEVKIKNISSINESNITIQYDNISLIRTRAEARALYSALFILSKVNEGLLPGNPLIQETFEESFYGQINSLFDYSIGEIVVDFGDNSESTKFLVKDDVVTVENIKPINKNVIYIRDYDPYDRNIKDYMKNKGSIVDITLNKESFEEIFYKVGITHMHFVTDEKDNFYIDMPKIREYLHIKNVSEDKLAFLILKHLVYHNSDSLMNGILIVEQPNISKKRLNIMNEILQLIQAKFGTAVYIVC